MQDGDIAPLLRVIQRMRPSVAALRCWMSQQVKNLYSAIPYGLALEGLCDWHGLDPGRIAAV